MKSLPGKRNIVFWGISIVALVVGVIHATSLMFVDDDCFITFRYAKNLVNGLGLVYNAGERVEAYTNFFWTMIIALGMKFNLDPVPLSMWLGIVFYSLNILLFAYLSWKFLPVWDKNTVDNDISGNKRFTWLFALPLTSLALSLHRDFNVYATSGLETSMFTFFVCAGFAFLLFANEWKKFLAAGFLIVLAMLSRPDGVLFLASGTLLIVLTHKKVLKKSLLFLAPSVLIFLPYWLWRYSYYGFFYPNTYYAKSADLAYYSQGIVYAWMYLKTYYVFFLIIGIALVYIIQQRRILFSFSALKTVWQRLHTEGHVAQRVVAATLFILVYSFYVIRVGGDFMFARFFIAITPALYFLTETILGRISSRTIYLIFSLLILGTTYFRYDQFKDGTVVGYIADEQRYYPPGSLDSPKQSGESLHHYFNGLPIRIAFWAGQLRLMYYAEPYYALEASAGLTDTTLAHQVLPERGRPGHEKRAPNEFFFYKKINVFFGPFDMPPKGQFALNMIVFEDMVGKLITYDNTIMSALEKYPSIRFVKFPQYLDGYISHLSSMPQQQVLNDYQFFRKYYFDVNQDLQRQSAIEDYIRSDGSPVSK